MAAIEPDSAHDLRDRASAAARILELARILAAENGGAATSLRSEPARIAGLSRKIARQQVKADPAVLLEPVAPKLIRTCSLCPRPSSVWYLETILCGDCFVIVSHLRFARANF
jgi:hypothetical protein